jgi:GDP-fucose transporter C1
MLYSAATGFNMPLITALFMSGVVGFTIGQATYMSINYTSALAHHVTGAAKSCIQTFLGILIWGEESSFSGVFGLLLSLAGSFVFMRSRMTKPKVVQVREEEV